MELRTVSLDSPAAVPLLAGLGEEYAFRYGSNEEMSRAAVHEFEPPGGGFVVIVDGAVTAAGGGFRPHAPGTCEIKRMWTDPAYRRRGLARRVLAALEARAAMAGYTRVVLETGPRQPEAEAMYLSLGYRRTAVYGHYPEVLAFEKGLAEPGGP